MHAGKKAVRERKKDNKEQGETQETPGREERCKIGKKDGPGCVRVTLTPFHLSVHLPASCAPPRKEGRSPRPYPVVPRKMVRGRCLGTRMSCGCSGDPVCR